MHSPDLRGHSDLEAPPVSGQPLAVNLFDAQQYSGLSRVTLYRLNAQGRLIFRKAGRKTLVDYQSLAGYLRSLPEVRGTTSYKPSIIA